MSKLTKGFIASISSIALIGNASAQDTDQTDEGGGLDVIVVQGLKQSQDLQDAPVSTSVVTGAELERASAARIENIANFVPGFTLDAAGPVDPAFVNLRGFINDINVVVPSTAFYVDDVPFTDFSTLGQSLFEIEQVEVLKGPQSTLYGVSSQAGVIVISSKAPSETFEASLSGTYGNFNTYEVRGRVSGPIIEDVLFGDIAFTFNGDDGVLDNTFTGNDVNAQETQAGRARLLFKPTDRLTATATFLYSQVDQIGYSNLVPIDTNAFNAFVTANQAELFPGFSLIPPGDFAVGDFDVSSETDGASNAEDIYGSIRVEYGFDTFDVVSVTALRNREAFGNQDFEGSPVPFFNTISPLETDEFSQEIRLASNSGTDSRYLWLVGASFQRFEEQSDSILGILPESILVGDPITPGELPFLNNSQYKTKNYGLFGQGTIRFMDERLGITGGARYALSRTEHSQDPAISPFSFIPNGSSAKRNDERVLWRAATDWRQTDDVTFFASVATGWKPAGVNPGVESPELDPDSYFFDTETSRTYEVGVKSEFFDNTVRLNATLYRNDIKNFQALVFEGLASQLTNAEKAVTQGFELEMQALLGDSVTIGGSVGYTNAETTEYTVNEATGFNFDGLRINGVPEWDYAFFASVDILPGLNGLVNVSGASGNIWNQYLSSDDGMGNILSEELLVAESDGYVTVDLALTYELTDRLSLRGFVNNVANERYFTRVDTFGIQFLDTFGLPRFTPQGYIGNPRIYGFTISANL